MYQVSIKGKTLEELKIAVQDIANELNANVVNGMSKDLSVEEEIKQVIVAKDDLEETPTLLEDIQTPSATPTTSAMLEEGTICKSEVPIISENTDLDSEGLPWDKRIHSGGKTKLKSDGTWKLKKGIETALVEQVRAELKATYKDAVRVVEQPVAPTLTVAAPVVEQPVAPPAVEPVAPVAPVLPQLNAGHTLATFIAQFPMIIATLITEGKISQEYVETLKAHFKVAAIYEISDDSKAQLFEAFAERGFIQKVA